MNCIILMTDENRHGREIIKECIQNKIELKAVVVESGSDLAFKTMGYLENTYYNPPKTEILVRDFNVPVYYVSSHNESKDLLHILCPDLLLLGGTRILTEEIYSIPDYGTLNAHPGILPKYKGLDVVSRAIENGDKVGATVHYVNGEVDGGEIIKYGMLEHKKDWPLPKVRIENMCLCARLMIEAVEDMKSNKGEW